MGRKSSGSLATSWQNDINVREISWLGCVQHISQSSRTIYALKSAPCAFLRFQPMCCSSYTENARLMSHPVLVGEIGRTVYDRDRTYEQPINACSSAQRHKSPRSTRILASARCSIELASGQLPVTRELVCSLPRNLSALWI